MGWILIQRNSSENISFTLLNGVSMLAGGILALLSSLLLETWNPVPVSNWQNFFNLTILMIIIANFISYNLYGYLLGKFTATFLSFAGF